MPIHGAPSCNRATVHRSGYAPESDPRLSIFANNQRLSTLSPLEYALAMQGGTPQYGQRLSSLPPTATQMPQGQALGLPSMSQISTPLPMPQYTPIQQQFTPISKPASYGQAMAEASFPMPILGRLSRYFAGQ